MVSIRIASRIPCVLALRSGSQITGYESNRSVTVPCSRHCRSAVRQACGDLLEICAVIAPALIDCAGCVVESLYQEKKQILEEFRSSTILRHQGRMLFLSWLRPSPKDQAACLARCKDGEFNYDVKFKGATRELPVSGAEELKREGFAINHANVKLGSGEDAFVQGKKALRNWEHFQLPWASVDARPPITEGAKFCVCAHEVVAWVMNPLQVIYVDSKTPNRIQNQRAAFTYGSGTLHGHMLAGEEKFTVEWRDDDSVWYEISSFAKPANFLSFVGYPVARLQQKMFAKQSMAAMLRALAATPTESRSVVRPA